MRKQAQSKLLLPKPPKSMRSPRITKASRQHRLCSRVKNYNIKHYDEKAQKSNQSQTYKNKSKNQTNKTIDLIPAQKKKK